MATVAITPDQNIITGEIFIAAPPARVFQAITDPEQMQRWWGASDMYRVTDSKADVRVGGKWSSDGVGVDGTKFHIDCGLDWLSQNHRPLGARTAKRARSAPERPGASRHRHAAKNSSGRLC
jgi:hypothetical protein